jgi:hypothetical protein
MRYTRSGEGAYPYRGYAFLIIVVVIFVGAGPVHNSLTVVRGNKLIRWMIGRGDNGRKMKCVEKGKRQVAKQDTPV